MKRVSICLLCVVMLLCTTACFKSEKTFETSTVPAATTVVSGASNDGSGATADATTTLSGTTGAFGNFPCVGYATDELRVRRDASTDYEAIGGLAKGDPVTIIGEEKDFYKIEWHAFDGNYDGDYAYVSKQYVSATPGGETTTAATTAVGSTPTSGAATTAAKTTVPTKPIVQAQ